MKTKWYGSADNRLMETLKDPEEITVGMGATEIFWSDRRPYEVTAVRDQKHITIRRLTAKHIDEAYSNHWELVSDPENPEFDLTKRGESWFITRALTLEEWNGLDLHGRLMAGLNGFDGEKLAKRGKQTKYTKMNIKFGFADKYYDYEF